MEPTEVRTKQSKSGLGSAVLIYKGDNHSGSGYVSIHGLNVVNGKPMIGPGRPATVDALRRVLTDLAPDVIPPPQLVPPNVLSIGPGYLVWWTPPTRRTIWIRNEGVGGERNAEVPHPGLVFAVVRGGWYVFAVKGNQRPDADTRLFQAPYFNVYENGSICVGSTPTPVGGMAEQAKAWEDAFFGSWFSHTNVHPPKKLVNYRGGTMAYQKALLNGKFKDFPERALVSQGDVTMASLMKGITNMLRN